MKKKENEKISLRSLPSVPDMALGKHVVCRVRPGTLGKQFHGPHTCAVV